MEVASDQPLNADQPISVEEPATSSSAEPAAAESQPETHSQQQQQPQQQQQSQSGSISATAPLSLEREFLQAKSFLKQQSSGASNLYDHLSQVLLKILQKQPGNAVDIFESLSMDVKRQQFHPESYETPASLLKLKEPSVRLKRAEVGKELLKYFKDEKMKNDAFNGDIPDMMDLANIFEWAGVSVGREEMFMVFAAVKKLVIERGLKSARFFGKMMGTQKDYLIVESERREDEPEDEQEQQQNAQQQQGGEAQQENPDEADIPKPKQKPNNPVPKEAGTGVNKYVYWVCNQPGDEWVRLPDAQPAHINASKQIRKFLTGRLDHQMKSYPAFNGTEAHYLRALIARISAATVISPTGYYKFDEEEEQSDDTPRTVVLNTEFEWPQHDTLATLDAWCHHVPYILPQGRTVWVNPNAKDDSEEKEDEEENEAQAVEPETGPSVLAPVAEDTELGGDVTAWTIRLASPLSPTRYSPVFLRSNRWPGAYTVGYNDKFANIYVGWGLKELSRPYLPPALPDFQFEYGSDKGPGKPEHVIEQNDPSVDDEKVFTSSGQADEAPKEEEEDQ